MQEIFSKQNITRYLQTTTQDLINEFYFYETITSTNDFLLRLNKPAPTLVITNEQSAGKGQREKAWYSPKNCNLYLSFSYSFKSLKSPVASLSIAIAVGLLNLLKSYDIKNLKIKWPNDLYYNNNLKLSGILIEQKNKLTVMGIGVNINQTQFPSYLINQATSLKNILGVDINRSLFAACFIEMLVNTTLHFEQAGLAPFIARFSQHDLLKDRALTVNLDGKKIQAIASGICEDGKLRLRLQDGTLIEQPSACIMQLSKANISGLT